MAEDMRVYEDVKDLVEDEIEKIAKKDELDEKCLEWLDKLVDIAKDVDTIFAMKGYGEDHGYSQKYPYYSHDDGMKMYPLINSPSMDGYSYRNRDSMGRYSRDGYDYRNRYSRDGDVRAKLEQMMSEATTEHEREAIRGALDRM